MTTNAHVDPLTMVVEDGVAIITFDAPGSAVNTVDRALGASLERMLKIIEATPTIAAAVLISGKPDIFIAGADIEQFTEFRTPQDARTASALGQELLDKVEGLRVPVVAAIHGACLGAGLETALACAWRVCSDHPKTVLGLPEVQLGIIPGAGGTQRLPRLIGLQRALDMILTGRNIRAKKALQMGLVDDMVHPAILREIAVKRAHELASKLILPSRSPRDRGAAGVILEDNPIGRSLVFRKAREGVMAKTHGHYPAPLAAIDVVRCGYDKGFKTGLNEEAKQFGELALTEVSRQLVFLFFATTALKKDPGVDEPAPKAARVEKLGILGAGFMGAGIASVAVQQGTTVRLKDAEHARVGKGLASVRAVLMERVKRKQVTRAQYDDMMTLAGGTIEYTGFAGLDMVIEAVFEDLSLKHTVLREVEPLIHDDAVYASNTSTIPITRIAEAAERPERVLGMHFFSPVHKMPLLEVIRGEQTSSEAVVTAVAYGKRLGKTVIVVNDGPGFYTTRTLGAYMNEAGMLLDAGAEIAALDEALVNFGFPVGPVTLLDEVGLDVGGKVGQVLFDAFGARMHPSEAMRRVVESGRTGRKGKSGFYKYGEDGKKGEVDPSVYEFLGTRERSVIPAGDVVRRCVLAMVNEAARCLEEGILRSARDGDIGAVFGIGFPPFRGGPFRYVDTIGADAVVRELEELQGRFGARFEPASLLVEMARSRRRFYPAEGKPLG
ncbi:MAG: fadJ [Gemmatimonadetes bacterium]|nr:fadJ [Gemmatimonadota bacterium]